MWQHHAKIVVATIRTVKPVTGRLRLSTLHARGEGNGICRFLGKNRDFDAGRVLDNFGQKGLLLRTYLLFFRECRIVGPFDPAADVDE